MMPWMRERQVEIIKSYLGKGFTMLEYGSGGSTICFPQHVARYISIEHDRSWMDKLIATGLVPANVELHHCPSTAKKLPVWRGSEEEFRDYINYVDKIGIKRYDAVLIDGRARKFCAKKILDYIDGDSLVFVHDFFERERYREILDDYLIIDSDLGGDEILKNMKCPASLAVLKKS